MYYYLVGIAIYFIVVFAIKRFLLSWKNQVEPQCVSIKDIGAYFLLISPDLFSANYYKYKIKLMHPQDEEGYKEEKKRFIKSSNTANILTSIILLVAIYLSLSIQSNQVSFYSKILIGIVFFRFVSRSFEITYAFVKDIFQDDELNTSGLNNKERISLALRSYIEIFIYSAAFYMSFPDVPTLAKAISWSLHIGSLTNTGVAFVENSTIDWYNLIFIQVFTTISLIVFSLSGYLSRKST